MRIWLTLAVAGCAGGTTEPEPVDATDTGTTLPAHCSEPGSPTWDNFARGYVQTWCGPCHSSSLEVGERQGAPVGVDFDTWSQVVAWADRIEVRATGERPDMPPLGGTDPADVERLARWLECGAPGEDPAPGPCDVLSFAPETELATEADADALCAEHNAATTLTVSGAVDVDCLCAVKDDLTVSGGALTADRLAWVGGDLTLTGETTTGVDLPALESVLGAVSVTDAPALDTLALPLLVETTGDITVEGLGSLSALMLPELYTAGGALTVRDSAGLEQITLPRLRTVGGAMIVEDLPDLVALDDTRAIETIDGDLVLRGLGAVETFDAFTFLLLEEVGGAVVIEDNPALTSLSGFTVLQQVDEIRVVGQPSLVAFDAFDTVTTVPGDLVLGNNPVQEHVFGFVNLDSVGGTLTVDGLPALRSLAGLDAVTHAGGVSITEVGAVGFVWLDALATVDGDVVVSSNPQLERIQGFAALDTLGGDLRVQGNLVLEALEGFGSLTDVGGTVSVGDNAALVALAAPRLETVGADLLVYDNPSLRNPVGWSGLRTIGGDLEVIGNATLDDVTDLFGIEGVGGGFTVRNNPVLPTPMVDAWVQAIGPTNIGGPVVNEDNG